MKWLSLFSGVGGFDLALRNKGHEVVAACEIDQYARSVYARHFPGVTIHENACNIDPEQLPDFDGICAGFPCQAFSIAGNRLGFEESRGTLFFEIARIAKQKRPRLLLLENVKGLLSHDGGRTFAEILATLDELGYDAEWQVLNSKYFVPQNRERIFIIGHLRGTTRPKVFPVRESGEGNNGARPEAQGEGERVSSQYSSSLMSASGSGSRQYINTIDANYHKGGSRPMIQHVHNSDSQANRIYDMIRRLTPMECERLQGFPDGWTDTLSDTQRYKCMGNAVTVPVIEFILSKLVP
jgi:DNA (cytosine-5)-methyltransferase 1